MKKKLKRKRQIGEDLKEIKVELKRQKLSNDETKSFD
jgi:hypothetical protein